MTEVSTSMTGGFDACSPCDHEAMQPCAPISTLDVVLIAVFLNSGAAFNYGCPCVSPERFRRRACNCWPDDRTADSGERPERLRKPLKMLFKHREYKGVVRDQRSVFPVQNDSLFLTRVYRASNNRCGSG